MTNTFGSTQIKLQEYGFGLPINEGGTAQIDSKFFSDFYVVVSCIARTYEYHHQARIVRDMMCPFACDYIFSEEDIASNQSYVGEFV
jgi:hypothetical protein